MKCTKRQDCAASSHFGDCVSMASAPIYTQAQVDDLLATVRSEEREAALLEAAKDVCMYCDKRALGYGPATGPNEAGNYTHESVATARPYREQCKASAIHARINFERAGSGIVSREP